MPVARPSDIGRDLTVAFAREVDPAPALLHHSSMLCVAVGRVVHRSTGRWVLGVVLAWGGGGGLLGAGLGWGMGADMVVGPGWVELLRDAARGRGPPWQGGAPVPPAVPLQSSVWGGRSDPQAHAEAAICPALLPGRATALTTRGGASRPSLYPSSLLGACEEGGYN